MLNIAKRRLIESLASAVRAAAPPGTPPVRLLNLGAGMSTVVEDELLARGADNFICDRVDISDCAVVHPNAGQAWHRSIEEMPEVPSASYPIAFSTYVLEHVKDLEKAAIEIQRVLAPGGILIATVPNPAAPEFVVAKRTGTAFHRLAKSWFAGSKQVWETHYGYKSIRALLRTFERRGLSVVSIAHSSSIQAYLRRFGPLRLLALAYDSVINALGLRFLQGNVCCVLRNGPHTASADPAAT